MMSYTVLARKYRPQKLSDLVGQETLVKVLGNSFKLNRIAHAFILTGSRGVGKTSTARIIAKGLNCENPAKKDSPTIDPCGKCSSCVSITQSRHIDVIEMDAASRTGVSDVREIIENIDYKTVSARFKVYIVDEVHMLSNSAFNALLKTLEEPPKHVKFIFATTEITKIPTTVISRCQRFDLTRIEASKISAHLVDICNKEKIDYTSHGLSLISNVADGSLRDALSILDQAIVHGEGAIKLESIASMLGIANQDRSIKLFGYIIDQKQDQVLEELENQYKSGVDPVSILNGLMETISKIMIMKIKKENFCDQSMSEEWVKSLRKIANGVSVDVLSRCWQIVLKNHGELKYAPDMYGALQMGILRLSFFSGLPGLTDLLKKISESKEKFSEYGEKSAKFPEVMKESYEVEFSNNKEALNPKEASVVKGELSGEVDENNQLSEEKKKVEVDNFEDLLDLIKKEKNLALLVEIENYFKLISFKKGEIKFDLTPGASPSLVTHISKVLSRTSSFQWKFIREKDDSCITIASQREETKVLQRKKVEDNPLVKEIERIFPGARIGKSTFH